MISLLQVLMLGILAWIGLETKQDLWYFAGLELAAAFAIYQQWLIREREPRACFEAFLNNNYFGMAVFVGLALDFALGS